MKKRALIFGVSSQDGSYLADLLLTKGYEVIGTIRHTHSYSHPNIEHLYGKIGIDIVDLIDQASINLVVNKYKPDELYNFAAMAIPNDSWAQPIYAAEIDAIGPVRVFEAVRWHSPKTKVYQALSRESFGAVETEFADEQTPNIANNPYGAAKAYARMMADCYRQAYGLFIADAILFNHESPRRSLYAVTRKITVAIACIVNNVTDTPIDELGRPLLDKNRKLHLGLLEAERDWGYAKDYVEAIWAMLQQPVGEDYVLGTGKSWSVKDFCKIAFGHVRLDWHKYVVSDTKLKRPTEIKFAKADYSKAKNKLGWEPRTSFEELVTLMVEHDLKTYKN